MIISFLVDRICYTTKETMKDHPLKKESDAGIAGSSFAVARSWSLKSGARVVMPTTL